MNRCPLSVDYNHQPFLIIWETTRACDLACVHCRASADPKPSPDELTHQEALHLIDEVSQIGTPILIFSGGDCLKRKDLFKLIAYAKSKGLRTGAIPAVTPALTTEYLHELKEAGLDQIAFSLDAACAKIHDAFRRTNGVFDRTLESIEKARDIGLRVQINSLINFHNDHQIEDLFDLVELFGIVFWEIFFLVPIGRGRMLSLIDAETFEEVFEEIYEFSQRSNFIIKITEAPHYRRFCYQQKTGSAISPDSQSLPTASAAIGRAPEGVNSGKGFAFISYRGDIMPSGFLPLVAGNIRSHSLQEVYRNGSIFQELRNVDLLKGRCGICAYKKICGGSRARAYAMSGDYLQEDPCCSYQPLAGSR